MKQGRRTLVRHTTQSTHDPHVEIHEEEIEEICEGAEAAVECAINLNSDLETTASTQPPPRIIRQYGQSFVTYRPKSDA